MQLPDGPKSPPLLQLIQWIAQPLTLMETNAQRYGDLFTVNLGSLGPLVFISHPQAIQAIFTADARQFDVGKGNEILRPLLGGRSLILQDGASHQRQRRLLMPPFHGERMRAYGKLINEITEQATNQWQLGQPLNARETTQAISLQVILQAVFGLDQGQRYQQLQQLLSEILNTTSSVLSSSLLFIRSLQRDLGSWSPWGQMVRRQAQIRQLIYAEIQARREQPDPTRTDILTLMLSARDEAGQPLSDAELHDELMTLLIAGHETTATAIAWALYWVHRQPEIGDKLRRELETVGSNADPNAIAQLPYLNAVCQETLRLYPVAMLTFSRMLKSPMRLLEYEFEPGTVLVPCIYLVHHREDLYPEPKQFKPERFLERQFSPYEYLPFGGGNRRCIGMAFAMFEMKLVLANILSRYELAIADNQSVKPVRRGVTLALSNSKWLVATAKQQPTNIPVLQ